MHWSLLNLHGAEQSRADLLDESSAGSVAEQALAAAPALPLQPADHTKDGDFVFLSRDALHFAASAPQKQQEVSYKPFTLTASERWSRDSTILLLIREQKKKKHKTPNQQINKNITENLKTPRPF